MTKWRRDPNLYYLKYLSDTPLPPDVQTQPMSVGSAFDAFVKSFLYEHLFGSPSKPGNDAAFSRDAIFEAQVQPHNRDWAMKAGEHCLNSYRHLGALDDLMLALGRSAGPPKFEMDIRGTVTMPRGGVVDTVPFRVKPDLHFVTEQGVRVIFDWKVNGYCSKAGHSPMQGFVQARRTGKLPWSHSEAKLHMHKGLVVNIAGGLEAYDEEWAQQCAIGAWVTGNEVGDNFVTMIHQLACRPSTGDVRPVITVAEHTSFVTPEYQQRVHADAARMWEAINSDWVFRDLSFDDSRALCDLLDQRKDTVVGVISPALED